MTDEVTIAIARLSGGPSGGEEGFKSFLYDDKTGKAVRAPVGNATIGFGTNVQAGWSRDFALKVLALEVADIQARLLTYWWYGPLDVVRRSVFLDVAFNVGVDGLLHFVQTIAAAAKGDWPVARDELLDSDAARELPGRYKALAQILLTGAL